MASFRCIDSCYNVGPIMTLKFDRKWLHAQLVADHLQGQATTHDFVSFGVIADTKFVAKYKDRDEEVGGHSLNLVLFL